MHTYLLLVQGKRDCPIDATKMRHIHRRRWHTLWQERRMRVSPHASPDPNISLKVKHRNTNVQTIRPAPTRLCHGSNQDTRTPTIAIKTYCDRGKGSDYDPKMLQTQWQYQSEAHRNTNVLPGRAKPTTCIHWCNRVNRVPAIAIVVYFYREWGWDYDLNLHQTKSRLKTQVTNTSVRSFRPGPTKLFHPRWTHTDHRHRSTGDEGIIVISQYIKLR